MHLALLAPIPFCYKDALPLLVLVRLSSPHLCIIPSCLLTANTVQRILMKDGTVPKDFETKYHQRADIVMKEVA